MHICSVVTGVRILAFIPLVITVTDFINLVDMSMLREGYEWGWAEQLCMPVAGSDAIHCSEYTVITCQIPH